MIPRKKIVVIILIAALFSIAGCAGTTETTPTDFSDSDHSCPPLSEGIFIEVQNTENITYNVSVRISNHSSGDLILTENFTVLPGENQRITKAVPRAGVYTVTSTALRDGRVTDTMTRDWPVRNFCDSRRVVLKGGNLRWWKIPIA